MTQYYPSRKYHCHTCGEDYESISHDYGERVVLDMPHRCQLPYGRFFKRTEKEYEYREGVLYEREVTYRKYSGHDVPAYLSDRLISSSDWVEVR